MKRTTTLCLLLLSLLSLSACCPGAHGSLLGLWALQETGSSATLAFYSSGLCVYDPQGAGNLLEVSPQARTAQWEYLPEEGFYQITWNGGLQQSVTFLTAEFQGDSAVLSSDKRSAVWVRLEPDSAQRDLPSLL